MPSTSAPFGLRPVNHPSGTMRPKRLQSGIASGYATALYKGVPVKFNSSGNLIISAGNDDIAGVFIGVEYTLSGRRMVLPYWPASTAPDTSEPYFVYYWDDPDIVYEIQSNASLAQTAIGDQADFASITAGAYPPGFSGSMLGSLVGAGNQGQFRVEALAPYVNNAWGDTYVIVQGKIARHQYVSNKVAI
jgi:hypothetical protein